MTASWVGDDERAFTTGIVDPVCIVIWCQRPWSEHGTGWHTPITDHEPVGQGRLYLAWEAAIREAVFRRDGWHCLAPGCTRTDVTYDHVLPVSQGGETSVENGQTLCSRHNSRKGDKTGPQYDYRLS